LSKELYPNLSSIQKILVIKLRAHGDVLLTTPVFSALKKRFPEAQIDGYIFKESEELLDQHPAISRLLCYDRKWKKKSFLQRLFLEYQILRKVKKERYDLVINLTEGDRGAIVAFFSKAPIKVGYKGDRK
jgi:heptosyltransferase III